MQIYRRHFVALHSLELVKCFHSTHKFRDFFSFSRIASDEIRAFAFIHLRKCLVELGTNQEFGKS